MINKKYLSFSFSVIKIHSDLDVGNNYVGFQLLRTEIKKSALHVVCFEIYEAVVLKLGVNLRVGHNISVPKWLLTKISWSVTGQTDKILRTIITIRWHDMYVQRLWKEKNVFSIIPGGCICFLLTLVLLECKRKVRDAWHVTRDVEYLHPRHFTRGEDDQKRREIDV